MYHDAEGEWTLETKENAEGMPLRRAVKFHIRSGRRRENPPFKEVAEGHKRKITCTH